MTKSKSVKSTQNLKSKIMYTSAMAWVFSFFELLFIVLTFLILLSPVKLLITGHRTEGTVIGMTPVTALSNNRYSEEANPLLTPQIEFYTLTGEKITVDGRSAVTLPSIHVGDSVKLVYDMSNPKDTQILSWEELPLIPAGVVFGFAYINNLDFLYSY
ncbi:DUF3592 domain-containing protein [Flavobacterium psychrotolerans]|uniref:DUF3592 domain-containing protein n=1 Tax=Flavobacterium psychrotolerans TaxID=2169410 RepID=A0A2U1JLN8_9FLAO|nr:DUF3592 domain-containing protein [Flavobacterium psychrotolerans]PWA05899.1 hypothetical protein DB895_05615 [Flavobacterium psychrotolerans]